MIRAKFKVTDVKPFATVSSDPNVKPQTTHENLEFMAVTDAPFDPDGNSEDNSFAKWTPSGSLKMTITNPALFGQFKLGQKFYIDFTEAK